MLIRIRLPGGEASAEGLRGFADIAEHHGDGAIDITARAAVQVRGLTERSLARVARIVERIGLLPSPDHDRVRNIVSNPFAGCDPDEAIDPLPFVRALDERLRGEPMFATLPAKFSFTIDGGGRPVPASGADFALRAIDAPNGAVFALRVGGNVAAFGLAPRDAVDAVIGATRAALGYAHARGESGWRLASLTGARDAALAALAPFATPIPRRTSAQRAYARLPHGLISAADETRVHLVPVIPLGRLTALQARALAAIAEETACGVRLGWWRGVALTDVARVDVEAASATLIRAGLVLDASDGFLGIAACAGSGGCTSALADVRADAAELARSISRLPARDWSVNVAGCGKRCAMRRGADVDLVATERGYDVLVAGIVVHADATGANALTHVLAARAHRPPETR